MHDKRHVPQQMLSTHYGRNKFPDLAMGQSNNENVVVLFSYVYVQEKKGKGKEKGETRANL